MLRIVKASLIVGFIASMSACTERVVVYRDRPTTYKNKTYSAPSTAPDTFHAVEKPSSYSLE